METIPQDIIEQDVTLDPKPVRNELDKTPSPNKKTPYTPKSTPKPKPVEPRPTTPGMVQPRGSIGSFSVERNTRIEPRNRITEISRSALLALRAKPQIIEDDEDKEKTKSKKSKKSKTSKTSKKKSTTTPKKQKAKASPRKKKKPKKSLDDLLEEDLSTEDENSNSNEEMNLDSDEDMESTNSYSEEEENLEKTKEKISPSKRYDLRSSTPVQRARRGKPLSARGVARGRRGSKGRKSH